MSKLKLLCSAIILSAATAILIQQTGCGGECSKASDCAVDEVCYNEICQPAFSPFFATSCQTDSDCDGDMNGQSEFKCELGRCRVNNTMAPVMLPDSGPADTSTTGADN